MPPKKQRRSIPERRCLIVVPTPVESSPLLDANRNDALTLAQTPTLHARVLLSDTSLPEACSEVVTLIPAQTGSFEEQAVAAFGYAAEHFSSSAICAIASATPHLPAVFVVEAFGLLGNSDTDVVFGLREEGGFYLIGVKRPLPELFSDLPWNHPNVLAVTLERAAQIGLKVALLPGWYGLETPDSLAKFQRDILRGVVTAPGTAATLGL